MEPHVPIVRQSDGILYEAIVDFFNGMAGTSPIMYPVLAFILLITQAIMITRFINNQRMMNKPNYLAGIAYLLITSLLPEWNYFSSPLICNTILL